MHAHPNCNIKSKNSGLICIQAKHGRSCALDMHCIGNGASCIHEPAASCTHAAAATGIHHNFQLVSACASTLSCPDQIAFADGLGDLVLSASALIWMVEAGGPAASSLLPAPGESLDLLMLFMQQKCCPTMMMRLKRRSHDRESLTRLSQPLAGMWHQACQMLLGRQELAIFMFRRAAAQRPQILMYE